LSRRQDDNIITRGVSTYHAKGQGEKENADGCKELDVFTKSCSCSAFYNTACAKKLKPS